MIELFPLKLEYCERMAAIAAECLPEHWSVQTIRDLLRYDNNIYYVAMEIESHQIVAFAGIIIIGDEAELLNIAVTEAFRKQGVAQKLMDMLLVRARAAGAYRLLLEVRESNEPAKLFYEKNRFSSLGLRKNYYSNPKEDAIIMERIL